MRFLLSFFEVLDCFWGGFWSVFLYPWILENECRSRAKHSFSPFRPSKMWLGNWSTKKLERSEFWEGFWRPFWWLLPPKTCPEIRSKTNRKQMGKHLVKSDFWGGPAESAVAGERYREGLRRQKFKNIGERFWEGFLKDKIYQTLGFSNPARSSLPYGQGRRSAARDPPGQI